MTGTFSNGTGEEKLSSTQDQQQQRPQEHERKDCRPLAPNPVAALIRRGAEEVGRLQGTRRATTKVQRMINSLQWRQAQSQDDLYHLKLESGAVLRLRQIQAGEITGLGTGVTVWPAAHVLAKYLELKFGEGGMKGFRTVDLGSGTGVAGIVAAALGAEAFLTDQEQLLFLMKENADRWAQDSLDHTKDIAMGPVAATDLSAIAARDKVHVQTYHWGMDDDALSPPVDIVLVSDCVLPKLYPIEPLVNAIHRLSGPDTVTIMSYEHRHYQAFDPRWKFRELAAERGLATAVVPQAKLHPIFSTDDIEIWEVRRHRAMPKDGAESRAIPKPTETSVDKPGARRESRAEVKVEKAENICEEGLIINGQPVPSERGDATKGELNVTATVLGERHELAQSPSGPIGCYLWPSAVVMARHLLAARAGPARNADDGKEVTKPVYPSRAKVLELGSGVGLVSIVAALLGWDIVSTDKANALPLLEANVRRCLSSTKRLRVGTIDVVEYDWGSNAAKLGCGGGDGNHGYDMVLCADCVYAGASVEPLLASLRQVCSESTVVLVTNELRSAFDAFLGRARRYFEVEDLLVLEDEMIIDVACNQRPKPVALKRLRLRTCSSEDESRS